MEWHNAGGWLMDHNAPSSFHGPSAYTPDGPDAPQCDDDDEYSAYLVDWLDRVACGEFEESGNLTGYWICDMIPGITYTDFVAGRTS